MIQGRFRPVSAILVHLGRFDCRPIQPDSVDTAWFALTQFQFTLIWLESGRIDWQPKWPKRIETAEIGIESCRNSQNRLWMRPKHPKSVIPQFYSEYLLLLLCFLFLFCVSCLLLSLFCESRHSNVFFKNILIVKIYRKYK